MVNQWTAGVSVGVLQGSIAKAPRALVEAILEVTAAARLIPLTL